MKLWRLRDPHELIASHIIVELMLMLCIDAPARSHAVPPMESNRGLSQHLGQNPCDRERYAELNPESARDGVSDKAYTYMSLGSSHDAVKSSWKQHSAMITIH